MSSSSGPSTCRRSARSRNVSESSESSSWLSSDGRGNVGQSARQFRCPADSGSHSDNNSPERVKRKKRRKNVYDFSAEERKKVMKRRVAELVRRYRLDDELLRLKLKDDRVPLVLVKRFERGPIFQPKPAVETPAHEKLEDESFRCKKLEDATHSQKKLADETLSQKKLSDETLSHKKLADVPEVRVQCANEISVQVEPIEKTRAPVKLANEPTDGAQLSNKPQMPKPRGRPPKSKRAKEPCAKFPKESDQPKLTKEILRPELSKEPLQPKLPKEPPQPKLPKEPPQPKLPKEPPQPKLPKEPPQSKLPKEPPQSKLPKEPPQSKLPKEPPRPKLANETLQPKFLRDHDQPALAKETPQPKLSKEPPHSRLAADSSRKKLTKEIPLPKLANETPESKLSKEPSQSKLAKDSSQPKLAKDTSQPKLAQDTSQPKLSKDSSQQKLAKDSSQPKLTKDSSQSKLAKESSDPKPAEEKSTEEKSQEKLEEIHQSAVQVTNVILATKIDPSILKRRLVVRINKRQTDRLVAKKLSLQRRLLKELSAEKELIASIEEPTPVNSDSDKCVAILIENSNDCLTDINKCTKNTIVSSGKKQLQIPIDKSNNDRLPEKLLEDNSRCMLNSLSLSETSVAENQPECSKSFVPSNRKKKRKTFDQINDKVSVNLVEIDPKSIRDTIVKEDEKNSDNSSKDVKDYSKNSIHEIEKLSKDLMVKSTKTKSNISGDEKKKPFSTKEIKERRLKASKISKVSKNPIELRTRPRRNLASKSNNSADSSSDSNDKFSKEVDNVIQNNLNCQAESDKIVKKNEAEKCGIQNTVEKTIVSTEKSVETFSKTSESDENLKYSKDETDCDKILEKSNDEILHREGVAEKNIEENLAKHGDALPEKLNKNVNKRIKNQTEKSIKSSRINKMEKQADIAQENHSSSEGVLQENSECQANRLDIAIEKDNNDSKEPVECTTRNLEKSVTLVEKSSDNDLKNYTGKIKRISKKSVKNSVNNTEDLSNSIIEAVTDVHEKTVQVISDIHKIENFSKPFEDKVKKNIKVAIKQVKHKKTDVDTQYNETRSKDAEKTEEFVKNPVEKHNKKHVDAKEENQISLNLADVNQRPKRNIIKRNLDIYANTCTSKAENDINKHDERLLEDLNKHDAVEVGKRKSKKLFNKEEHIENVEENKLQNEKLPIEKSKEKVPEMLNVNNTDLKPETAVGKRSKRILALDKNVKSTENLISSDVYNNESCTKEKEKKLKTTELQKMSESCEKSEVQIDMIAVPVLPQKVDETNVNLIENVPDSVHNVIQENKSKDLDEASGKTLTNVPKKRGRRRKSLPDANVRIISNIVKSASIPDDLQNQIEQPVTGNFKDNIKEPEQSTVKTIKKCTRLQVTIEKRITRNSVPEDENIQIQICKKNVINQTVDLGKSILDKTKSNESLHKIDLATNCQDKLIENSETIVSKTQESDQLISDTEKTITENIKAKVVSEKSASQKSLLNQHELDIENLTAVNSEVTEASLIECKKITTKSTLKNDTEKSGTTNINSVPLDQENLMETFEEITVENIQVNDENSETILAEDTKDDAEINVKNSEFQKTVKEIPKSEIKIKKRGRKPSPNKREKLVRNSLLEPSEKIEDSADKCKKRITRKSIPDKTENVEAGVKEVIQTNVEINEHTEGSEKEIIENSNSQVTNKKRVTRNSSPNKQEKHIESTPTISENIVESPDKSKKRIKRQSISVKSTITESLHENKTIIDDPEKSTVTATEIVNEKPQHEIEINGFTDDSQKAIIENTKSQISNQKRVKRKSLPNKQVKHCESAPVISEDTEGSTDKIKKRVTRHSNPDKSNVTESGHKNESTLDHQETPIANGNEIITENVQIEVQINGYTDDSQKEIIENTKVPIANQKRVTRKSLPNKQAKSTENLTISEDIETFVDESKNKSGLLKRTARKARLEKYVESVSSTDDKIAEDPQKFNKECSKSEKVTRKVSPDKYDKQSEHLINNLETVMNSIDEEDKILSETLDNKENTKTQIEVNTRVTRNSSLKRDRHAKNLIENNVDCVHNEDHKDKSLESVVTTVKVFSKNLTDTKKFRKTSIDKVNEIQADNFIDNSSASLQNLIEENDQKQFDSSLKRRSKEFTETAKRKSTQNDCDVSSVNVQHSSEEKHSSTDDNKKSAVVVESNKRVTRKSAEMLLEAVAKDSVKSMDHNLLPAVSDTSVAVCDESNKDSPKIIESDVSKSLAEAKGLVNSIKSFNEHNNTCTEILQISTDINNESQPNTDKQICTKPLTETCTENTKTVVAVQIATNSVVNSEKTLECPLENNKPDQPITSVNRTDLVSAEQATKSSKRVSLRAFRKIKESKPKPTNDLNDSISVSTVRAACSNESIDQVVVESKNKEIELLADNLISSNDATKEIVKPNVKKENDSINISSPKIDDNGKLTINSTQQSNETALESTCENTCTEIITDSISEKLSENVELKDANEPVAKETKLIENKEVINEDSTSQQENSESSSENSFKSALDVIDTNEADILTEISNPVEEHDVSKLNSFEIPQLDSLCNAETLPANTVEEPLMEALDNLDLPSSQSLNSLEASTLDSQNLVSAIDTALEAVGNSSESCSKALEASLEKVPDNEDNSAKKKRLDTLLELKRKCTKNLDKKQAAEYQNQLKEAIDTLIASGSLDSIDPSSDSCLGTVTEPEENFESLSNEFDDESLASRLASLNDLKIPPLSTEQDDNLVLGEESEKEKESDMAVVEMSSMTCTYCDCSFASNRELKKHVKVQHRQRLVIKITKTDSNEHKTQLVEPSENTVPGDEQLPLVADVESIPPSERFPMVAEEEPITDGEIKIIVKKEGGSKNSHVVKEIKITPKSSDGGSSVRIPGFSPALSDRSAGSSRVNSPAMDPSGLTIVKKPRGRPRKYPIFTENEIMAREMAAQVLIQEQERMKRQLEINCEPVFEPVESIIPPYEDRVKSKSDRFDSLPEFPRERARRKRKLRVFDNDTEEEEPPEPVKVKKRRGRPPRKKPEQLMQELNDKMQKAPVQESQQVEQTAAKLVQEQPAPQEVSKLLVTQEPAKTAQLAQAAAKPLSRPIPALVPTSMPIRITSSLPLPLLTPTLTPTLRSTVTQPLKQTPVPPMKQTPVPPLKQTPVPPLKQTPVPPLKETPVPPLKQTPVLPLKQTAILPLKQPPVPPLAQTSMPPLRQTPVRPPPQTAVPPLRQTAVPFIIPGLMSTLSMPSLAPLTTTSSPLPSPSPAAATAEPEGPDSDEKRRKLVESLQEFIVIGPEEKKRRMEGAAAGQEDAEDQAAAPESPDATDVSKPEKGLLTRKFGMTKELVVRLTKIDTVPKDCEDFNGDVDDSERIDGEPKESPGETLRRKLKQKLPGEEESSRETALSSVVRMNLRRKLENNNNHVNDVEKCLATTGSPRRTQASDGQAAEAATSDAAKKQSDSAVQQEVTSNQLVVTPRRQTIDKADADESQKTKLMMLMKATTPSEATNKVTSRSVVEAPRPQPQGQPQIQNQMQVHQQSQPLTPSQVQHQAHPQSQPVVQLPVQTQQQAVLQLQQSQQFCILFIPDYDGTGPRDVAPTATIVNFQPVPDNEIHNKPLIYMPTTPTKISVDDHAKAYVCANCTKVLDLIGRLEANVGMTEEDKSAITCPYCSNHFQSLFYLEYHVMHEHLKCENEKQCRHSRFNSLRIPTHEVATEYESYITFALKCRSCYDIFSSVLALNDHVMHKHKTLVRLKSSPPTAYGPNAYPVPFVGKNGAIGAVLQCPSDCVCRIGIRSTDTPLQRQQMLKRCPNAMRRLEKIEPAAYEVYTCTLCKSTFLMKDEVVDHLMKMHEVSCKFPCYTCLTSFRSLQIQENHRCSETTLQDFDKLLNIAILPTNVGGKEHNNKFLEREDSSTDEYGAMKTTSPRTPPASTTPNAAPVKNGLKRKNGATIAALSQLLTKKPKLSGSAKEAMQPIKRKRKRACPKCTRRFAYRKSLHDHVIYEHIMKGDSADGPKKTAVELLMLLSNNRANIKRIEELAEMLNGYTDEDGVSLRKLAMMEDTEQETEEESTSQTTNAEPRQGAEVAQCIRCKIRFNPSASGNSGQSSSVDDEQRKPLLCDNCEGLAGPKTRRRAPVNNGQHSDDDSSDSQSTSSQMLSFSCKICSDTFPTIIELKSHKRAVHAGQGVEHLYSCDICTKTFAAPRMLEKHKKIHRESVLDESAKPEEDEANRSSSQISGDNSKDSETNDSLNDKVNSSNRRDSSDSSGAGSKEPEEQLLDCSFCEEVCSSKVSLKNHLKREHGRRASICQFCNGLLIDTSEVRHMLDYHIVPSKTNKRQAIVRNNGNILHCSDSCMQEDVDELIRTLGKHRLQSLMVYHDFEGKCNNAIMRCPSCPELFATRESCRFHYVWIHDDNCLLCDETFRSGSSACQHKVDAHTSTASYLWCIQRLVTAIVNTLNLDPDQPSHVLYEVLAMRLDDEEEEARIASESTTGDTAEKGTNEEAPSVTERFLEEVLSEDQLPDSGNMIEVVIGREDSEDDLLSMLNLSPNYETCEQLPNASAAPPEEEEEEEEVPPAPTSPTAPSVIVPVPTTPTGAASTSLATTVSSPVAPSPTSVTTASPVLGNYCASGVYLCKHSDGDEQFVLVVAGEDETTYKNDIGSLAVRISETCEVFTLEEITEMLRVHFANLNQNSDGST